MQDRNDRTVNNIDDKTYVAEVVKVLDFVPLWTVNKGYILPTFETGNNEVDDIEWLLTEAQVAGRALGVQESCRGETGADIADVVPLLVVHVTFSVTFVNWFCGVDTHRLVIDFLTFYLETLCVFDLKCSQF